MAADGRDLGIDSTTPHIARVYDYWLGGKDNFAADREAAEKVIAAYPAVLASVRAQRAFLGRAVRYLAAEAGIRQFLDIGTGLPSADNTHEVAQRAAPESRVVYVDNDPIVLRARPCPADQQPARAPPPTSTPTCATPARSSPRPRPTLDFAEPVAILLVGVLHCIPDADDPAGIVRAADGRPAAGQLPGDRAPGQRHPRSRSARPPTGSTRMAAQLATLRTAPRSRGFFDGLDLVEPGLVQLHRWRPGPDGPVPDGDIANYGAVARKP